MTSDSDCGSAQGQWPCEVAGSIHHFAWDPVFPTSSGTPFLRSNGASCQSVHREFCQA